MKLLPKSTDTKEYSAYVSEIVDRMRIDTDRQAYTPELFMAVVESWSDHLQRSKVPAELLEEIYGLAMDLRSVSNRSFSFTIEDMLRAWVQYKERAAEQVKTVVKTEVCPKCNNTGYFYVTQNGKKVEIFCNHE